MTFNRLFFYVQGKAPAVDDGNNDKDGDGNRDQSPESEDRETQPPPNVRSKDSPVIKG